MKSVKLIAKGRVQKVGYRSLVDEIAFALGVRGYVKNLENKTVEIVAEHEDEKILDQFAQLIKINEFPIRVNEVITEKITPKKYSDFEVIEESLDIENKESLEAGAIYMRKLASGMNQMNSSMNKMTAEQKLMRTELGEKIDKTNERLDTVNENLGNKIDGTNVKLDSFSGSTIERFDTVDRKYGKISQGLDKLDTVPGYLEKMSNSLEKLIAFIGAGKK